MTTHEWIMLIIVLLGGFWTLNRQLSKIEVALSDKVGHKDCYDKRSKCPCHKEIDELRSRVNTAHPPK